MCVYISNYKYLDLNTDKQIKLKYNLSLYLMTADMKYEKKYEKKNEKRKK